METTIRQARRQDAEQMLRVYNSFIEHFVGSAERNVKSFRRMLRKKEYINWVSLDNQKRVVGYVHARVDKRFNRGVFREVIVDPKHDFVKVAKPLIERVSAVLMEKKVSEIVAGSIRNPRFEKLFPAMGFFESESLDVFMYGILDAQKFLNEVSQVFVKRLGRVKEWSGLAQIECDGCSLFLQKTRDNVEHILWTNQPADFKVKLGRDTLAKLIFGVSEPIESFKNGQLAVETTVSRETTHRLLESLFPQRQFLVMDYW